MKLYQEMNVFLSNQFVFFMKLHNMHWYVNGRNFFSLHEKFEELYDASANVLDEVAERLLIVNQKPVANLKEALSLATIAELPNEAINCDTAVVVVLKDLEILKEHAKEIEALAIENDSVTEGMFVDYIKEYEKIIWMLNSMKE